MSVSMKDLDPAFQGVGNKVGIEIWTVDKDLKVTAVKDSAKTKLRSGCCYILLHTRGLQSGVLHHDIHFWIGKDANHDEASAVIDKSMELDFSLGGRAVQYREEEGHETEKFLSYFKPCFLPIAGIPSVLNEEDDHHYSVRLFKCSGRHVARMKEVPFVRSSLSHDYVFILDTKSKIFQFNGAYTDVYQRRRALNAVQYLKENNHAGNCHVAVIEDGKFVADVDSGDFWGFFGGFAPLGKKVDNDFTDEKQEVVPVLYCVHEGQLEKVEQPILKRLYLSTNKCYMVDCGTEVFQWVGRDTQLEERKIAARAIERMIGMRKNQHQVKFLCTIEGFEPLQFKSKFESWPVNISVPISEKGRGKVAALLKHKGFDVKGLLKAVSTNGQVPMISSAGKLQVWCVNGKSKESVPPNKHGKLFNKNCYIILYTYPGDRKDEQVLFCWFGRQSTTDIQESAQQYMKDMADSLGRAVEARIFEGKEPPIFTSLFQKLFIIKGDDVELGVRLFQVQQSSAQSWQAIEVELDATSLNSSACMILQIENSCTTWYGKFSTIEQQEATEDMAHYFQPHGTVYSLKEGSETEVFWNKLGGKKAYPSHQEPKESPEDPHLFSCNYVKGQLKVAEVYGFSQDDLFSDEVMILDCHTDIFVWVGQNVKANMRTKAMELGQKYVEQAARYKGISSQTPLYKIKEGYEPLFFKSFFSWDSSKQLNVPQRKALSLKGLSTIVTALSRKSLGSLQREPEVSATPAKSMHGRISPMRSANIPSGKPRAPKSKHGDGSTSILTLSSLFESTDATPTPKLPATSTRRQSFSGTPTPFTPPRTPRTVTTPRSPAIAALASVFELYSEKKLDFAWPGMKPNSETKCGSDVEVQSVCVTEPKTSLVPTEESRELNASSTSYPYERLKVSSSNPIVGLDVTLLETYLSDQDFEDTFHMDKDTFYKLPKWKQEKHKKLVDLF